MSSPVEHYVFNFIPYKIEEVPSKVVIGVVASKKGNMHLHLEVHDISVEYLAFEFASSVLSVTTENCHILIGLCSKI